MKSKIIVVVFVVIMLIPAYSGCFNDIPMSESARKQLEQPAGKRAKNQKPYKITMIQKSNLLMLEATSNSERASNGYGYNTAIKKGLQEIAQNNLIVNTVPITVKLVDGSATQALLVYIKPQ